MPDNTDMAILELLRQDSRLQWKEIGEKVHLTGQAVALRIRKLEDMGVLEGYTVRLNMEKLGRTITGFVTVSMKTAEHQAFQQFIRDCGDITEAHRISGSGCYLLKVSVADRQELNRLLDEVLRFGNYSLNISIGNIK